LKNGGDPWRKDLDPFKGGNGKPSKDRKKVPPEKKEGLGRRERREGRSSKEKRSQWQSCATLEEEETYQGTGVSIHEEKGEEKIKETKIRSSLNKNKRGKKGKGGGLDSGLWKESNGKRPLTGEKRVNPKGSKKERK